MRAEHIELGYLECLKSFAVFDVQTQLPHDFVPFLQKSGKDPLRNETTCKNSSVVLRIILKYIDEPTGCNNDLLIYKISSTCFGQYFAHHQKRETEIFTAHGILLLWWVGRR